MEHDPQKECESDNMNICKEDCEHYEICIEDDEYAKCDDCSYCEFYEKEYTIEDGIKDINNNHDELKSMFEWNIEFFDVLTKNLINLKEKDNMKVTLSMLLTTEIMEKYKIMLNVESIINNYETTLTSSEQAQFQQIFEKCGESINALCEIDAQNGGSLGFVLNKIINQENITIGMIGISECETLITRNNETGEFELIKNRFPIKRNGDSNGERK